MGKRNSGKGFFLVGLWSWGRGRDVLLVQAAKLWVFTFDTQTAYENGRSSCRFGSSWVVEAKHCCAFVHVQFFRGLVCEKSRGIFAWNACVGSKTVFFCIFSSLLNMVNRFKPVE